MGHNRVHVAKASIAVNAALSNEIDLTGHSLVGIQMPADWTAADLTFQGRPGFSDDTGTWPNEILQDLYDDTGTETTVQADADRFIGLTGAALDALTSCGKLKIRSGTTATPVVQLAARVILCVLVPLD